MNKAVIIGIAIAIIVGIIGIYAVSTQDGGPIKETGIGIGEQVGVTVEEKGTAEIPTEEEKFGLEDEADVKVEEPEEEPERIDIVAREEFKLGDKLP